MRRDDAALLAVALGLCAFAIVYFVDPGGPVLDPLGGTWHWRPVAGRIAMTWFSRVFWACLAGVGAATVAWRAGPWLWPRRALSARWRLALTVTALGVVVGLAAWLAGHELGEWLGVGMRGS